MPKEMEPDMSSDNSRQDREAFLAALEMWNRPQHELGFKGLDADCDTDAIIDRLFSTPAGGFLKD